MTPPQVLAIAFILLGVVLVGLALRPGPARTIQTPVEPRTPGTPQDGRRPDLARPIDPTEPVEAPASPLPVVETHPFTPLLTPGRESTTQERRVCRDRLGADLDADLAEVLKLIESRPPALRGMLLNASSAVVSQELAVLRAYLRGALTGLDTRLRNGPLQAGDEAVAACLVSALGRLPTHHGVVFHRALSGDLPLEAIFFPGSLLVEPAFARAERNAFPAHGVRPGPLVNYVIWSETGRRTPLLVSHTDTVLFAAATRFRVLAVEPAPGLDVTVYLSEDTDHPAGRNRSEHQILEHLRNRATTTGVGPIDGPAPSPVAHPGVDETGRPYAVRTGREGPVRAVS